MTARLMRLRADLDADAAIEPPERPSSAAAAATEPHEPAQEPPGVES
jgi:hypothetical protein